MLSAYSQRQIAAPMTDQPSPSLRVDLLKNTVSQGLLQEGKKDIGSKVVQANEDE